MTDNNLTKEHLSRAGVGKRYYDVTLDRIPNRYGYKEKIRNYIDSLEENISEGRGLLITGPYGSGKTGSSVIIMKYVLNLGGTALMVSSDDIMQTAIEDQDFDDRYTMWERMSMVDLFVMDDLGGEHVKEFGKSKIEKIVRNRYNCKRATIVTSNLMLEELAEQYQGLMQVLTSQSAHISLGDHDWREMERKEVSEQIHGN